MKSTPRRALIVIDVQNEYFSGGLRIAYPARSASLGNIALALDAAYAAGIPVVVVQNYAPAGAPLFAKSTPGWELHPAVAGRPRDYYVEKTLPSAFSGTDLEAWARARGIDTLTLVGYMTHNCIASTAVAALHAGFTVEVLQDATGAVAYANAAGAASAEEIHRAFCVVLHSRFAAVASTRAWIAAAQAGAALQRGSIVESSRAALAAEAAR